MNSNSKNENKGYLGLGISKNLSNNKKIILCMTNIILLVSEAD